MENDEMIGQNEINGEQNSQIYDHTRLTLKMKI